MAPRPIYLDNLATTPVAPEVRDAMLPWLAEEFGNASSTTHEYGWSATEAVEAAREHVGHLIGATRGSEIVFTSGATESNNTVLKGVAELFAGGETHIVTTAIEHPSVLAPCDALVDRGVEVSRVRPDAEGIVSPDEIERAIGKNTRLVSVMLANNEIGSLQPVKTIADIARPHGALVHADAAQAVGKVEVDVHALGVDFLSLSAHKFYGPKGIGALYVRSDTIGGGLPPLLHGGGQEAGVRSGTLAVPQIVGMGEAAHLAGRDWRQEAATMRALADRLCGHLSTEVDGITLNGPATQRLPGCLSMSIEGVLADGLIASIPGLAMSSGSACSGHHGGGSHVLEALGHDQRRRDSTVRIGIGRYNSAAEIDTAAELIIDAVARLRVTRAASSPARTAGSSA